MNVLADLLKVTATCIGDLVKQTREILEDHGHNPGVAAIRFGAAGDLLAFLAQDIRPARTTIIETLHPNPDRDEPRRTARADRTARAPAGRPDRTAHPSATRRPPPPRRPGWHLPPEDQQRGTGSAHHPPSQKTVHIGRPRRRSRRRKPLRDRWSHPRNPPTTRATRPHSSAGSHPLPHRGDLLAAGRRTSHDTPTS